MEKIVYSLKKKGDTEELHLFKATSTGENSCAPENSSICNKMSKGESSENKFSCKTESDARIECAKIGRHVCGNCIITLYTTYK